MVAFIYSFHKSKIYAQVKGVQALSEDSELVSTLSKFFFLLKRRNVRSMIVIKLLNFATLCLVFGSNVRRRTTLMVFRWQMVIVWGPSLPPDLYGLRSDL